MKTLKAACIQMRSGTSVECNVEMLSGMVRQAAGDGARYIQTPEMSGLLQKNPKLLMETVRLQDEDPVFAACSGLAGELGIWLHLGSTAIRLPQTDNTGKAANRAALFAPTGELKLTYDKIHMFDVSVDEQNQWRESNRFEAGNQAYVVEMDGIKTGISICYDMRFPQLYRHQARLGAQILTCPSSFTKPTGRAHWEIILRARAIENGAFMLAAAQGGTHEDGRETYGHSMMINPGERLLANWRMTNRVFWFVILTLKKLKMPGKKFQTL